MFKLLIVDDEYYTVEGMRHILDWEKYGIEIVGTASDGTEGLKVAREVNPDIIITDIRMPENSGLEMIESLRQDNYKGKVIILSGYHSFSYAKRAIDFNVEKYLTKPINPTELEETVKLVTAKLKTEKGTEPDERDRYPEILRNILHTIDKTYTDDIRLSNLADKFFLSTRYVGHLFKKYLDINFIDYVTEKRIEKAKELLANTDIPIDEVMGSVGYHDAKHFREMFKKITGMSPSEFRKMSRKLT